MKVKHLDIITYFDTQGEAKDVFNSLVNSKEITISAHGVGMTVKVNTVVITSRQNKPAVVIQCTDQDYQDKQLKNLNLT